MNIYLWPNSLMDTLKTGTLWRRAEQTITVRYINEEIAYAEFKSDGKLLEITKAEPINCLVRHFIDDQLEWLKVCAPKEESESSVSCKHCTGSSLLDIKEPI